MNKSLMRYLFVIIAFFFASLSLAQTDSSKAILESVRKHYQNNTSFTADVVFEIDVPESPKQVMDGKIYLKENKYRFVLDNQEIISDDVNLWHWTKEDGINEVQVSYVKEDENVITPTKIFDEFLKGFAYRLVHTTKHEGNNIALIEITPVQKNDTEDIFKVKVVVNKDKNSLQEMNIFSKDGVVYTFKIVNEKAESLSDDIFSFKTSENPNVEVIDLR